MSTQDLSGGGFNFDSESGVAHLLASLRAADISPEKKNDLRDTIFLYTNGGRDQTVRLSLEQKISSYGVTPIAVKGSEEPAAETTSASPMGFARSVPTSFAVTGSSKSLEPTLRPKTSESPSVDQAGAPEQPVSTAVPSTQSKSEESEAPAPSGLPVATPAKPTPTPPAPPKEPSAVTQAAPTSPTPDSQSAPYLDRIKEIKAKVNERVGNPVNLVDIDNEVGREYMGALLDAMKKINSGASAISAMQRLEAAYTAVEKAVAEHKNKTGAPSPTPPTETNIMSQSPKTDPSHLDEPTHATTPDPAPQPSSQSRPTNRSSSDISATEVPAKQTQPAPKPTLKTAVPQSVTPPAPKPAPKPQPQAPMPAAQSHPTPPESPSDKPPAQDPISDIAKPSFTPHTPAASTHQEARKAVSVTEEASETGVPITSSTQSEAQPVARDRVQEDARWAASSATQQQASQITSTPSLADTLSKKAAATPQPHHTETKTEPVDRLHTPEVDAGLDQLLSEWSLFKKSGLFGTGPKGREHPLFKKIAGLQIPFLLAGRFEGATQEIKQSITDYMNGWRYEQGIIYNQGETFEQYLRRVIRHILDLQKK